MTTSADDPASPYTGMTVETEACYRYRYVVSDNLGNAVTYTSASAVSVDQAFLSAAASADGHSPATAGLIQTASGVKSN